MIEETEGSWNILCTLFYRVFDLDRNAKLESSTRKDFKVDWDGNLFKELLAWLGKGALEGCSYLPRPHWETILDLNFSKDNLSRSS